MQEDRRLAQRMQQGDRRAFEEFIDAYGAQVHRLVRRYIDNPSDAEDVTQEIMFDLFRGITSFRGDSSLTTYIYRVAVNRCLRHCQRNRRANAPLDSDAEQPDNDWHGNPEQCATKRELSEQVHDALETLSALHRDVVILHELHGLTYQECADVLEVPIGTVKSRLSNAFRRLRDRLSGYVLGETPALQTEIPGGGKRHERV